MHCVIVCEILGHGCVDEEVGTVYGIVSLFRLTEGHFLGQDYSFLMLVSCDSNVCSMP